MNLYIEFIILLMIIGSYFIIKWKLEKGRKKALKLYDPEKDMSGEFHKLQLKNGKNNKGGVFDTRPDERTDKGIDTIVDNPIRPEQSEGRELLPQTTVSDAGENSPGTGKNSSSIRTRLFGRRKAK